MGLQMNINKGAAMMVAEGVTTITMKIEENVIIMETDTADIKDTTGLTINVAAAETTDTDRLTHSQATIQQDTNQTMAASNKMVVAGEAIVDALATMVATTSATTDHVAVVVLGVGCRTIVTTVASMDNIVICVTKSSKEDTAVGADLRSDMKHGY